MLKEWFFFPKSDRRAILFLASLLVIGLCILWWRERDDASKDVLAVEADSSVVALRESASRQQVRRRTSYADTLAQRKGDSPYRKRTLYPQKKTKRDTTVWIKKLPAGSVVDLNSADTTLLKRVPGIGSWRARRIVQFRGHLGGYSRVGQLLEINGMPDTILHWFEVKTPPRQVLNLNHATLDSMAAHPYLTYKQARVIINHRRKHGPLRSLSQLSLYPEFANDTLKWLEPYVTF